MTDCNRCTGLGFIGEMEREPCDECGGSGDTGVDPTFSALSNALAVLEEIQANADGGTLDAYMEGERDVLDTVAIEVRAALEGLA